MWQHKIEAGFIRPPSWSAKFEIVQQSQPVGRQKVN